MTETTRSGTLVIDLDGTLIRSDTTHELLVLCARWAPLLLPLALFKFLKDKSAAKRWLVEKFGHHLDPEHLPYEDEVLTLIRDHAEAGGDVWLVSGGDHELVGRVADHLGFFSRYQGSEPGRNLTSARKAEFLKQELSGYSYAGNSNHDLAVWQQSTEGYAFRAPKKAFSVKSEKGDPVLVHEKVPRSGSFRPLRKTMRLHQWAKNILVFVVPGLLISELQPYDFVKVFLAFICFGLMASGTYILNDLFDIPDDRRHATKKLRQIADGRLSVPAAVAAMTGLILVSLIGALLLNWNFAVVLVIYGIVTVSYSFRLKRLPIIDVFILAGLFSLRVWGGAEVVSETVSAWFMMFIGLVFLSLALAKRYVEIRKSAAGGKISGRGYRYEDAPMILAFGAGTSNAAVLALAIYGLLAPTRLIDNAFVMMVVACLVGGWFMRIWLVAGRGELNDDPVLFAVKDKVSLACLVIVGGLMGAESLRPVWSQWF